MRNNSSRKIVPVPESLQCLMPACAKLSQSHEQSANSTDDSSLSTRLVAALNIAMSQYAGKSGGQASWLFLVTIYIITFEDGLYPKSEAVQGHIEIFTADKPCRSVNHRYCRSQDLPSTNNRKCREE